MHMHSWDAIILIVMIVWAVKSIRRNGWRDRSNRHGRGQDGPMMASSMMPPPLPAQPDPALSREVEELRKRIAVLERIATDDRHGRKIADEIEALRDPRPFTPTRDAPVRDPGYSDFRVAPTSTVAGDERR